jgi:hypothetical protein
MRSKLAVSALAVASFLATTAIASAQNEPQSAPGATSETGAKSHATHHKMKSSNLRKGTTTGMSHRSSTAKPGSAGPSTSNKSSGY